MTSLDRETLRALAEWDARGFPVASMYLDVDGRRHPRRADYVSRVEDLARRISDAPASARQHERSLRDDAERIVRFVRDEFDRRGTRGLALFTSSGAGLWEALALPRPLRERTVVGPRPYLLPLEALLEAYETISVAIVDREKARLFRSELGEIEEVSDVLDEVPGWHDQGGWAQARFQRHIMEHVQRHLKHVAEVLLRLQEQGRLQRLVLAGPEEVVAELDRELHDYVRRTVVRRTTLSMASAPGEVLERIRAIEQELEREREEEAVSRLLAESEGGTGRAVTGMADTLAALEAGRVDTLVLADDLEVKGARCRRCGHLDLGDDRCPACGGEMGPVPDLAEEAVEGALRQRCRVETVPDASRLERVGGVGALLRF